MMNGILHIVTAYLNLNVILIILQILEDILTGGKNSK